MAVRSILLSENRMLRKRCRKVKVIDQNVLDTLADMAETMYANEGAGLAASQIGVPDRLIVVDTRDGSNLVKMINPMITSRHGKIVDKEGCLSIPRYFGNVQRPEKITVEYTNESGQKESLIAEGFKARCICHEIDHLNGVLFVDKIIKAESAE